MWPRMPETVLTSPPWNLATSSELLNMDLMKAVFLIILNGSPTNFSFFITSKE